MAMATAFAAAVAARASGGAIGSIRVRKDIGGSRAVSWLGYEHELVAGGKQTWNL